MEEAKHHLNTAIFYIFGTQLPTVTINIPLDNRVQTLDIDIPNENPESYGISTIYKGKTMKNKPLSVGVVTAIGIGIGTGIGVALGNMVLGIGIGAAAGALIGSVVSAALSRSTNG
ncbi:hypothetical protein KFU94_52270 [Chloroflexi bacterium TSY]|nr:hypothetical protein [Chloroflexi bacterium TSY]